MVRFSAACWIRAGTPGRAQSSHASAVSVPPTDGAPPSHTVGARLREPSASDLRANAHFAIRAFARIGPSMVESSRARHLRDALRHLVVAHGALEEARRPCGAELPIVHAYALLELLQCQLPMTVSELAGKLAIDRTNVSRLCARMESNGELLREPHPKDGRARTLRLTAKGKRVARSVDARSARHFERLVERLGSEVGTVVASLSRLSMAMAAAEEEQ